jgi:hypothetical protein
MPQTFKISDVVFDLASRLSARIVAIHDDENGTFYELDSTVPLDPTKNGAFPNRTRCTFEVCALDDRATIDAPFNY